MVTSQAPSTLIASDIDLGNAIVYYCDTSFSTFTAAAASTKWRKLGLLNEGVQIEFAKEPLEFYSGAPAKLQQTYYISEGLQLSGQIMEVNPRNIARIMGGLTITETVKTSSPAATTVATGSTKSVVKVASSTGYAVDDEIRVGNSGSYQYGRIASISGNDITLYEDLSGDANPTTGHAVAKIDTTSFEYGALAAPSNVGLKIIKTMIGGYGSWALYIAKAQFDANTSMAFGDNTQSLEGIGMPFTVKAISDPNVESGKLAKWIFTQS